MNPAAPPVALFNIERDIPPLTDITLQDDSEDVGLPLESVRELHDGLQSLRIMKRMEASLNRAGIAGGSDA